MLKSKKSVKLSYFSIIFTLFCLILGGITPALAESLDDYHPNFDPDNIISDRDLTDYNSLNMEQIRQILVHKGGTLAGYVDPDTRMSAAQIIYDSAQVYKINPKYILVLLQKEQSLVVDSTPTQRQMDWATGYAVCDSCSMDDPVIQKFKGFKKQVSRATWRTRYYIEHPSEFRYQIGQTYNIDGIEVTLKNSATVALFTYTPHIHGNYNFWRIWNDWFSKSYPDGSLVQMEGEPGVWYIDKGVRRPILSRVALVTRFDSDKIIQIGKADLERYEIGTAIKYANYSLLQLPTGGIYLLDGDTKRPIASQEAFRKIGFNPEEVEMVTEEDLTFYETGLAITEETAYPTGSLLQDKSTGGVYWVYNNRKHAIWGREILEANFSNLSITPVPTEELQQYLTGRAVKLKEGELIRLKDEPDSKIYVISHEKKRPFKSKELFDSLGYKEENILEISLKIFNMHVTGEEISD